MTTTTTTPNMNLVVPVPSAAPGPEWAAEVVSAFSGVDSHNHSSGQGVLINPGGMSINSDLPFGSNNATALRSTRFTAQGSPLAAATDIGCVYVSGSDLWYNDVSGNQVRITTGGNVNAGAGSITGLPSGTASVAFAGATYTFQSATNTGATISAGPVAIGSTTASAKHTTIASNAAQAADLSLVLPTTAGAGNSVMANDGAGNMSWDVSTGTGPVVRQNAPAFTGTPTGTITAGTYSPTLTASSGSAVLAGVFFYHRIANIVTVSGWVTTNGSTPTFTVSLPFATVANFSNFYDVSGSIGSDLSSGTPTANSVQATIGAKTVAVAMAYGTIISRNVTITFMYSL